MSEYSGEEDFYDEYNEYDEFVDTDPELVNDNLTVIANNLNIEYIYSKVPVFIDVTNDKVVINFDVSQLDKEYVKLLNIKSDIPLIINVSKIGTVFEINTIDNAGILLYPIYRSKHNTLKEIIDTTLTWINNPGKWCPVCGDENVTAGPRPVVCNKGLCRFYASEIGGLINLYEFIPENWQLMDLLWTLLYQAVVSPRKEQVTNPFPEGFTNKGEKDWELLLNTINSIPKFREIGRKAVEISKSGEHDKSMAFESYLQSININIPYLMRWLVGTLRTSLKYNKSTEREPDQICKRTFKMLAETPERMAAFNQLASKYPVINAFHGSPIENWHSILRHSLKNYSCTDMQLHGAVHGQGIYLAPQISTAQGYVRSRITYENSIFNGLGILLKAEIINHDIKESKGFCYVIEDENKVRIIELCLF